jgi:hypothetical protein
MSILGETRVRVFGTQFVFLRVAYSGAAVAVSVDQPAVSASVLSPDSGGPTVSLGSASGGLKTLTLAAGGTSVGGAVIVVLNSGKTSSSFKP